MRHLFIIIFLFIGLENFGQCPQVFDFEGNATTHPYWYACNGGAFDLNLQSPDNWTNVMIDWGDGTPPTGQVNWNTGTPINHNYASAVDTFVIQITSSNVGCPITGVVVMEQAASASIQIPVGGVTQGCAPQLMSFINSSTNVSQTTVFHWDFGDNSADLNFDASNLNATVNHTYQPGSVSCETVVTLTAENYCNTIQGGASVATFNPIRIWDTDLPNITVANTTLCFPETTFSFTNSAQKNCFTQGNIFQRQEKWNFGDYWGTGPQETDWIPFPPNLPQNVTFPGLGDYTISVLDSNFCGIEIDDITVHIVNPPVANFTVSQDTVCVGQNITFTQLSVGGNQHFWNFDGNWIPSNGGVMNFSFNNPGTYTVSYRIAQSLSPTSCSDTMSREITVLAAPTTQIISQNNSACDSLHVVLSQSSTGNPVSYSWNLINGQTFTGPIPPSFDITTTGNYTVSLTVTASNGCTASDNQLLQVITTPVAQFTSTGICQNSPVTFLNNSGNNIPSIWSFGDGQTSNAFAPSHTYPISGDYIVQLIAGVIGCQDTITDTLVISPLPTVLFSPSSNVGCTPFGVSFSNNSTGTVSQTWTFGDGSGSSDLQPSHVFLTNPGSSSNYSVTLSASNSEGCTASSSLNITVNSGAYASFTDPNSIPECSPHESAFINNSQNAISYLWDFGDGNTSTSMNPVHIFENNTGVIGFYNVQLIAYSSGACHDTTEQTVVVFPSATFALDFNSYTACSPVEVPMPLLTGAAQHHWIFGDGNESFAPLPTHVYSTSLPSETFDITFIGTSVFGCSDTTYSSITILGGPTAAFSVDQSVGCEPATVVFNNNSENAASYLWDFQDGPPSNASDSIFTHTFQEPGDFIHYFPIELVAISDNGCTDTANTLFTLHPEAVAQFIPSVTADCAPFNCLFQNTSSGATQFSWNLGDGNSSVNISPSHVYQNLITHDTTYLVTLIASNGYGCSDTSTQAITVNRTPVAYFDITDTSGCYPLTITFDNGSVGADGYSWNYGTGETSINAEEIHQHNFFNLSNIAVTNAVVLAATTNAGCYSTYTMPVTVPPGLSANFTGDIEGCHPFQTLFLNQSIGALSYEWDFGDGNTSTDFNPNHIFQNINQTDTSYLVTLTATNALGCTQSLSQVVQVFPVPTASISASPLPQVWPDPVIFQNNSISNSNTNYLWDLGNGTLYQDYEPDTFSYATWGNYNVLMIANNGQCSDTAYLPVPIIAPDPIAGFTGDTSGCAPLIVAFQDTSIYTVGWLWEFGDGGASINTSPVHTYDTPGTYTVRQIVMGYNGQNDTTTHFQSIVVFPRASAVFTVTPAQVTIPQQPVYIVNLSENANQYFWDFGDGDTSSTLNPDHIYTEEGLYDITLMVNNEFNCPDTLTQWGAVRAVGGGAIEFPNAFSPKTTGPTDGTIDVSSYDNDVFFPKFEGLKSYELTIYDKWGEVLFHSTDVYKGWDGYYKGEICQQDAYIWKSNGYFQNGQSFELTGSVTLVRK